MLLDELLAERERANTPPTPPPVLTVDPVAVPPTADTSRRAVRQRLADLEDAAVRNYRSAEEARRVLADEHQRLQEELAARTHAQHEAAALRREVDRLTTEEAKRSAQERTRAERAARAQIADELKRFQEEHERVVHEMTVLRSSLSEHDGLLDEYVTRLREEQGARAMLRAELDRAEAARSLAERSLQRATENARHGAEDEMIRLATAEQQLADAVSDRDRFAAQLAELTSGDGAIGRLTAQLEERDAEIASLGVRIADLGARIDASEDAARDAIAERDTALAAQAVAEARLREAEQARAEAEEAVAAATTQIAELEAGHREQAEESDAHSRELDKTLGKLRREARDASNARRTAEGDLATAEAERDELRARVADLEAESVRARADGDRLRAHAAMLGDELAAARATAAELQAAASAPLASPAPTVEPRPAVTPVPEPAPTASPAVSVAPVVGAETAAAAPVAAQPAAQVEADPDVAPPLPLRIAGRHTPAPPLARRRPRRAPGAAPTAAAPEPEAEPVAEPAVEEPPARPRISDDTSRRTALAEFSALATSSDDFSYRRR